MGVRLVAMTRVPVDKSTLRLGSSDAGTTVHSAGDDSAVQQAAHELGQRLHLRAHRCKGVTLALALDVELHRAHDGRVYALDLSRLLPPVPPDAPEERALSGGHVGGAAHLWRLFRSEFVNSAHVTRALCADAYSQFMDDKAEASAVRRPSPFPLSLAALTVCARRVGRGRCARRLRRVARLRLARVCARTRRASRGCTCARGTHARALRERRGVCAFLGGA